MLATRIRTLLADRGMTQAGLADLVGCRPLTINRIVLGKQMPSVQLLRSIAKFLDVSMDELVREDDETRAVEG